MYTILVLLSILKKKQNNSTFASMNLYEERHINLKKAPCKSFLVACLRIPVNSL